MKGLVFEDFPIDDGVSEGETELDFKIDNLIVQNRPAQRLNTDGGRGIHQK